VAAFRADRKQGGTDLLDDEFRTAGHWGESFCLSLLALFRFNVTWQYRRPVPPELIPPWNPDSFRLAGNTSGGFECGV
jgi:hypothetical protein